MKSTSIVIGAAIVATAGLGYAGYRWYKNRQATKTTVSDASAQTVTA